MGNAFKVLFICYTPIGCPNQFNKHDFGKTFFFRLCQRDFLKLSTEVNWEQECDLDNFYYDNDRNNLSFIYFDHHWN